MKRTLKLTFLGKPGAGKGTYAWDIAKLTDVPLISTGDIFRYIAKSDTELAKSVKKTIDSGGLVPDGIVNEMVRQRLEKDDCIYGFILDGYPRTLAQDGYLDQIHKIDAAVHIDVPDEVVYDRAAYRLTCKKCSKTYNEKTQQPINPGAVMMTVPNSFSARMTK